MDVRQFALFGLCMAHSCRDFCTAGLARDTPYRDQAPLDFQSAQYKGRLRLPFFHNKTDCIPPFSRFFVMDGYSVL